MKNRKQKGQAILEFALIVPLFVFIGLGMADILWMMERAGNVEYIANETARCEAISGILCNAPNTPESYADKLATNLRMDTGAMTFGSSCDLAACTVSLSYGYKPLGVWFPHVTIRRTGIASLPGPPPGNEGN